MNHRIRNFTELAKSPLRSRALSVAEEAYAAIDTGSIVRSHLSCVGSTLSVGGQTYDLSAFRRVRVVGFGKVSCKAAEAVEALLRNHVSDGAIIGVRPGACGVIDLAEGTHPRPSPRNVELSKRIVEIAEQSEADDLVIVIVSGGGSSFLCWPLEECAQATRLYDDFLKTGATIQEMNTVRKHLSSVKGGGLARMLYPATVIGLIFCDVPGDHFEDVASGPTYQDESTVEDANDILARYRLSGYAVSETPKEARLFERVRNVPLVSNTVALAAMERAGQRLGYTVVRAGNALYDAPRELIERMYGLLGEKTAVIGGGESSLTVTTEGSKGGRCQYVALQALARVREDEILLAFASDGIDNTDAAGAIADADVRAHAREHGLSLEERLADYDTYDFFKTAGGLLYTGVTDANVSDLFLLMRGS